MNLLGSPIYPLLHSLPPRLVGAMLLAGLVNLQAQTPRPNAVVQRYAELCASCHGANLEGAQAPSMLDDVWTAGGDDESLAKSIRNGFPEKGMPTWSAALPEKEIRAFVIYIREQRAKFEREKATFSKPAESITVNSELHPYQLNTWVGGVVEPWSLAFLPGNRALVTEKRGRLLLVENGRLAATPITGVPEVDATSQGGLYDVVPHPNYARNGWLYLAYADPQKDATGKVLSLTRIIRGKLKDGALVGQGTIYQGAMEHYRAAGGPTSAGASCSTGPAISTSRSATVARARTRKAWNGPRARFTASGMTAASRQTIPSPTTPRPCARSGATVTAIRRDLRSMRAPAKFSTPNTVRAGAMNSTSSNAAAITAGRSSRSG